MYVLNLKKSFISNIFNPNQPSLQYADKNINFSNITEHGFPYYHVIHLSYTVVECSPRIRFSEINIREIKLNHIFNRKFKKKIV